MPHGEWRTSPTCFHTIPTSRVKVGMHLGSSGGALFPHQLRPRGRLVSWLRPALGQRRVGLAQRVAPRFESPPRHRHELCEGGREHWKQL